MGVADHGRIADGDLGADERAAPPGDVGATRFGTIKVDPIQFGAIG
ncbi:MAG TPA: hypothetical protein PLI18_14180 [Pirellulaceae bacterium]|nr:hypothetical protein [Pirellulaceae bacterium]